MTTPAPLADPAAIAARWLEELDDTLTGNGDLSALLIPDAHWRDAVAFSGTLNTYSGPSIATTIASMQKSVKASHFAIAANHTAPRFIDRHNLTCVEAFFSFTTTAGDGLGFVRLIDIDGRFRARNVMTTIDQLSTHPEKIGERRPIGQADASKFGGPNWLDRRKSSRAYADRDPDVLVVGAGQNGLALAARLGQLDVDTLVIDTHERPGDGWRQRYHALTLHNAVWLNDMPYMPYPPTWPVFLPKDKLAGWFEAYVEALEINFWGSSTLTAARYDAESRRWHATVTGADGTTRVLRPRHIVMATGVSGIPNMPELPGLKEFSGEVVHSSWYTDSTPYRDKDVIVIGTGNSAHDVAQDLHANGVGRVTMVQRQSTTIISVEPSAAAADRAYLTAPTLDDCDLINLATPFADIYTGSQELTRQMRELDRDLIAALESVGFRTDYGPDDTGQQMKYMTRGGGYYLNVGCSELIISGEVGLLQYVDVDTFEARGLRLKSGELVPADLVVLATGYKSQQEAVRQLMGDEVAERVGPIWGYDDDGEVRNMWRPTGQDGLWFSAGNFQMCRIYSKVLALQLRQALDNPTHTQQ